MDSKRAFDLALATPAFILSLPLQAGIAVAIGRNMGRPVIFKQDRPGLHGTVFTLYKFRTMRDVDEANGVVDDDDRITQLGHFLRSTSLDELPTLWNVIKGDMSLVGPRPLLVRYLERYSPEQARRHEVRPGMTGLAQVSGRNAITWEQKFAYDVEYVDRRSLRGDLAIIARTLVAVVRRDGISAANTATMPEFGIDSPPNSAATMTGQKDRVVVSTTIERTAAAFTGPLRARLEELGYEVVTTAAGDGTSISGNFVNVPMNRQISPLKDLASLLRVITTLRRIRPVAVVTLTPKASMLGLAAARVLRVPRRVHLLVGLPLETSTGPKAAILRMAERLTSRCATVTIANSPSLARSYESALGLSTGTVRSTSPGSDHGVDASFYSSVPESRPPIDLPPGRIILLFLGRITRDKGLADIITAIEDDSVRDSVGLLVVGAQDEPDSAELVARANSSSASISLVPEVDDIRPYLHVADVLVLPSYREGFPNVVLEAAAAGVPTLTTNATGCVDSVIDGETGWVVNVGAPNEITAALKRLCDEPKQISRAGAQARDRAWRDFRPAVIVGQVCNMAGFRAGDR